MEVEWVLLNARMWEMNRACGDAGLRISSSRHHAYACIGEDETLQAFLTPMCRLFIENELELTESFEILCRFPARPSPLSHRSGLIFSIYALQPNVRASDEETVVC